MTVYLIAFSLTLLFSSPAASYYRKWKGALSNGVETKQKRANATDLHLKYDLFFFLAFFPIFFIAAFRYNVGTDYSYTYIPNFLRILRGAQNVYSEPGFILLNKLVMLFTKNPQGIIVVTSFFYAYFFMRTIVRYSESAPISVLVLFLSCLYFASLNNVRQAVASVIVFAAYPYLKNGDFVKFCLCILGAMIFHWAAVIMLVPFVFINSKFLRKHFFFTIVALIVLLPAACKILASVLAKTKYNYFFVSEFNNGRPTLRNIVYHLFFFALSFLMLFKRRNEDKAAYLLLVMQFLAFEVSCVSLFIRISEMIMRVTMFFQIFQVFLIPKLCSIPKNSLLKGLVLCTYSFLYGLYLIDYIVIKNFHAVLPYQWVF